MPSVTVEEVATYQREADARAKIAVALRDANLTTAQILHLLASMTADYAQRLDVRDRTAD